MWTLSSSDDGNDDADASILRVPKSQEGKQYLSPFHIKEKQVKKFQKKFSSSRRACPYGNKCYRKNPQHLQKYFHSLKKDDVVPSKKACGQNSIVDSFKIWTMSAPNYIFLTSCAEISSDYNHVTEVVGLNSMGIKDILSDSFGLLVKSVQFNYCIDIDWLMEQYPANARDKPLLIVHGEQGASNKKLQETALAYPNICLCGVDLPPYGTHHTKMMFLHYHDALRIVISTANLLSQDWDKKTQGFYMSPMFSLKREIHIEGQSKFKSDLVEYLAAYKKKEIFEWIDILKHCDIRGCDNIRLIGSVPGRHTNNSLNSWGHMKLRTVLKSSLKCVDSNWPVIGQFSSIGSLGPTPDKWLCGEWLTSLSSSSLKLFGHSSKTTPLKLIFPTVDNVRCSLEGYPAGASLPYSYTNSQKQTWLLSFLHQWKADHVGRTQASPHIKSYTRVSPYDTNQRAAWFLLTSANLSKAAWGSLEKKGSQLAIRSYELGVLFLPQALFKNLESKRSQKAKDNFFHIGSVHENHIALPFSYPLTPYSSDDQPWTWDSPHNDKPDRYGNIWEPS